jgi:hypothetical protein
MEAQGFGWPPDERPHYEKVVAILGEAKESRELERVGAAGRALTPRAAVDVALGSRG